MWGNSLQVVATFCLTLLQLPGIFGGENHMQCSCPNSRKLEFILQEWKVSGKMVMLGSCSFMMGSNPSEAIPGDKERHYNSQRIRFPFWIHKTEVTKEDFVKFIQLTNHRTTAEELGTSFVFSPRKPSNDRRSKLLLESQGEWWLEKKKIHWKTDFSLATSNHPVTHVSWWDSLKFCQWEGGTLPQEAEWEYACRGGLNQCLFPWGNTLKPNGTHMTNIWQGKFPVQNSQQDGFKATAPVMSFPPNDFGLYEIVGNVWEWILDPWSRTHSDFKIQKGGSFMCHRMHCYRYRCGARSKGSSMSTSSNLGFRCIQYAKV